MPEEILPMAPVITPLPKSPDPATLAWTWDLKEAVSEAKR